MQKPEIKIFQIALDRAGCKPEEAVMVGDRLDNDIVPANKIGMTTVWIKQGFGGFTEPQTIDETPDYIIDKLTDIYQLIGV